MAEPDKLDDVKSRLAQVRSTIQAQESLCERKPGAVALLAVSKGQPAVSIRSAYDCGQRAFGENYLREALQKMEELGDCAIEWHFIGRLQSNKTRSVATHFDWVHSIDRARIAQRLSTQRPASLPALQCCLELRLDADAAKGGVTESELDALAALVDSLPGLQLRGLMTIPASADPHQAALVFARLADCYTRLRQRHRGMDTLSMGMSGDMGAAIAAGSTLVRIGTAIFGPRNSHFSTGKQEDANSVR